MVSSFDVVVVAVSVIIAWHVLLDVQFGSVANAAVTPQHLSAQNRVNLVEHFVQSVRHAEPLMHWIREQSAIVADVKRIKRQALYSTGNPTADAPWDDVPLFDDDNDDDDSYLGDGGMMSGEMWYNSFRRSECEGNNGAYCSAMSGAEGLKMDSDRSDRDDDWFETYKNFGNNITLDDLSKTTDSDMQKKIDEIIKAQTKTNSNNLRDDTEKQSEFADYFPVKPDLSFPNPDVQQNADLDVDHSRTYRHLEDQTDQARNDLSHEAHYKLSKFEQDRAFQNRSNRNKRSVDEKHNDEGLPVEIVSGSADGLTHKFVNELADDSKQDDEYSEDDYEEENERDKDPTETASLLTNCTRKSTTSTTTTTTMRPKKNKTSVISGGLNTTFIGNSNDKGSIGITLEVKINNVTRQRIQTLDDLRRRKKDTSNVRRNRRKPNENDSIDDLISGKQPSQLISAVFEMVRNNEQMKHHIRPLINLNDKVHIVNPDNHNTHNQLKANGLMNQIMTSMNDIIRDEVNEQTCVTLRPDLQRYVDDIREFYAKERIEMGRQTNADDDEDIEYDINVPAPKKRRTSKYKRSMESAAGGKFDRTRFTRQCNRDTIHEKYVVIVGLLRQYERLDRTERQQVSEQKRYVDDHLHLLDELEAFVVWLTSVAPPAASSSSMDAGDDLRVKKDVAVDGIGDDKRSNRFDKLIRTVDLLQRNAMLDDDEDGRNGFGDEYGLFDDGMDYA